MARRWQLGNIAFKHLLADFESAELEHSDIPSGVVLLGELITSNEFPYAKGDFPSADVDDWERDDYKYFGEWALDLLVQAGVKPHLKRDYVRHLYILGLGPQEKRLLVRSGYDSYHEYQKAIGSDRYKPNGTFTHWTLQDFINHAAKLSTKLGRKPKWYEYDELAEDDENAPTHKVILDHAGGSRKLHDFLGYPDFSDWDKDDYIDWGVKILRANPNISFSMGVPRILSQRGRGPGSKWIETKFGLWSIYKSAVLSEFAIRQEQEADRQRKRLELTSSLVSERKLPEHVIRLPVERQIQRTAKYEVAAKCLPNHSDERIRFISKHSGTFIDEILRADSRLTAGDVENVAVRLGVFDDIWPMNGYLEYLKVA